MAERKGFIGIVYPGAIGMHADAALAGVAGFAVLEGVEFDDDAIHKAGVTEVEAAAEERSRITVLNREREAIGAVDSVAVRTAGKLELERR